MCANLASHTEREPEPRLPGAMQLPNRPRQQPLTQRFPAQHFNPFVCEPAIIALPILAIFFLAQRQFIEGITLTGLKG